jgi:hypothetical protein
MHSFFYALKLKVNEFPVDMQVNFVKSLISLFQAVSEASNSSMSGGRTGSGTGAQSRPTSDTEDVGFLDSVSQVASGSGTGFQ